MGGGTFDVRTQPLGEAGIEAEQDLLVAAGSLEVAHADEHQPAMVAGERRVRSKGHGTVGLVLRFREPALLAQLDGQVQVGLQEIGTQLDRLAQRRLAGVVPSLRGVRDAEVVVGLDEVGLQLHGPLVARHRLVRAPEGVERVAEVVVGAGELRPQPHGLAEADDRVRVPLRVRVGVAQVVVSDP